MIPILIHFPVGWKNGKQLQFERPGIALSRSRRMQSSVSSTTEIPIGWPVRSTGTLSSRINWADKEAATADCPATCSARERITSLRNLSSERPLA
jgi:hypothetical protein